MSPTARSVARSPLETAGRVGYAVKGVLYLLLGVLAVEAARGGGSAEDKRGALQAVAEAPLGGVLIIALAIGLAAYGLWRLALAALDPEGKGSDAKGWASRARYVFSGLAYLGMAYAAFRISQGSSGSGGGTEERTRAVLDLPGGHLLVGLVALGVIGYGIWEFVRAYKADFMEKLDLHGEADQHRTTIQRIGQAGLAARGVVYGLIGIFLGLAALRSDADEARGLDGALKALSDAPYGPWLLGLVGLGLAAYGLYCGINARYRRFEGDQ